MSESHTITQIVYISSTSSLLSKEALTELLIHGSEKNAQREITGILLYKDGNIIQVIEGPESEVSALMAKIRVDPRHRGIIVLVNEVIEKRQFPSWSMAFRDIDSEDGDSFRGIFVNMDSDFVDTIAAGNAKTLVASFRDRM